MVVSVTLSSAPNLKYRRHTGPGNFMEVAKLLPLLTAASPDQPSFHVVAFSLPGFGFSEAPRKKGFAVAQYAEVSIFLLACIAIRTSTDSKSGWT